MKVRVGPEAAGGYLGRMQALGQRLGEIKPTCLSTLEGWEVHLVKK